MADNQEENIKYILTNKGKNSLNSVIDSLSEDMSRQTFYNKIRQSPLDKLFIEIVKTRLKIDLPKELLDIQSNKAGEPELSKDYLIKELIRVNKVLEEVQMGIGRDKDRIIELQEKIALLNEQLHKKQG
jgi:hypothetical protein